MFDIDKATLCVEKMKKYFSSSDEVANVGIPSNIEIGSSDYVTYIFYSCLLDYGMRSSTYHSNLIHTYQQYKDIFNPCYVVENYEGHPEKLLEIIKENIHPRYPNIALKKWLDLSIFLNRNYPDDQLKEKICSLSSYKELYHFITSIQGYGQKTGGLLLRLIYESGMCHFTDELDDIPIDRHDVEISYLNEIVDKEQLNPKKLKLLGTTWIQAAKSRGVSACDIDKYLWSIGNRLCSKKRCFECPVQAECKTKM